VKGDSCALGREGVGAGGADPARSAGDEHALTGEARVHERLG
jgi:hypothetical protein